MEYIGGRKKEINFIANINVLRLSNDNCCICTSSILYGDILCMSREHFQSCSYTKALYAIQSFVQHLFCNRRVYRWRADTRSTEWQVANIAQYLISEIDLWCAVEQFFLCVVRLLFRLPCLLVYCIRLIESFPSISIELSCIEQSAQIKCRKSSKINRKLATAKNNQPIS